jgi:hypothetical protein
MWDRRLAGVPGAYKGAMTGRAEGGRKWIVQGGSGLMGFEEQMVPQRSGARRREPAAEPIRRAAMSLTWAWGLGDTSLHDATRPGVQGADA